MAVIGAGSTYTPELVDGLIRRQRQLPLEELRLMDILESEPIDVLEKLELRKNSQKLHECFCQVLNDREQKVIAVRYGLAGRREMTQREIAQNLGISRSYVSRIEKNALRKLRECFET